MDPKEPRSLEEERATHYLRLGGEIRLYSYKVLGISRQLEIATHLTVMASEFLLDWIHDTPEDNPLFGEVEQLTQIYERLEEADNLYPANIGLQMGEYSMTCSVCGEPSNQGIAEKYPDSHEDATWYCMKHYQEFRRQEHYQLLVKSGIYSR